MEAGNSILGQKAALPRWLSIFLAAFMASMVTYLVTSMQLALAFSMEAGGVAASFVKFAAIFAVTQIPLAVSEGYRLAGPGTRPQGDGSFPCDQQKRHHCDHLHP
ncbi:MAG: energy-coupling factor ABC transporter permease [Bacillota bacterium]